MIQDAKNRQRGVGADILIRPKNSSLLSTGYTMPGELVAYFQKQAHVKIATGVLNVAVESITLGASGIDFDEFSAVSGGFKYQDGGGFQGPDSVIVDDYIAGQRQYKVGDTIKLDGPDPRRHAPVALAEQKHHLLLYPFEEELFEGDQGESAVVAIQKVAQLRCIVHLQQFCRNDHR